MNWLFKLTRWLILRQLALRHITITDEDADGKPIDIFTGRVAGVTIKPEGRQARFYVNVSEKDTWSVGSMVRVFKVEYPTIRWNKENERWEAPKPPSERRPEPQSVLTQLSTSDPAAFWSSGTEDSSTTGKPPSRRPN